MRAAGAFPARLERVPERKAAVVKIFGRVGVGAHPSARGTRTPFAERASNALEIRAFIVLLESFKDFFDFRSYFISHKTFLKLINQNLSIKEINFKEKRI
jgi:hypothetical protein